LVDETIYVDAGLFAHRPLAYIASRRALWACW
jgi:hypothetical protein